MKDYSLLAMTAVVCALSACTDSNSPSTSTETETLRVTVIMESREQEAWKQTAAWAIENISQAQQGMDMQVRLYLTFKSQDDADYDDYMRQLATDDNVDAVIGPTTTAAATRLASEMTRTGKPMISPTATGVEYQRAFATRRNIWNMAECDIAELEAILGSIASTDSYRSMALLIPEEQHNADDGEFAQWFGFLATEYGLSIEGVFIYKDEGDMRAKARELCGTDWRKSEVAVVLAPSSAAMALAFDDEAGKMEKEIAGTGQYVYTPTIYCTDAFVTDSIRLSPLNLVYNGFEICPHPESGFATMYSTRFGKEVSNGEAQLYDAITLTSLAAAWQLKNGGNLNDALEAVVNGRDGGGGSWLPSGLRSSFTAIAAGGTPDISGASGELTFDTDNRAGIKGTCYRLWRLSDGEYHTMGFFSGEQGKRTFNATTPWGMTASQYQTFSQSPANYPNYTALGSKWAVLVSGSDGWGNYRFEADVFAMYQMLRQHGYDDSHIILISEDDIAFNRENTEQGVLRVSDTGPNVYSKEAVDYLLSDLAPEDLSDILLGNRSDRLPHVVEATDADNVFVFWSGHGSPGKFNFGNESLRHSLLADALRQMPHRKMLVAVESCYSGSFGEQCKGIPGLLVITAANPYETSHAAEWDPALGVYRSNGFTKGFQTAISTNHTITLRDLYYQLARSTSGSHVTVYNAPFYGNVYTERMDEFLGN